MIRRHQPTYSSGGIEYPEIQSVVGFFGGFRVAKFGSAHKLAANFCRPSNYRIAKWSARDIRSNLCNYFNYCTGDNYWTGDETNKPTAVSKSFIVFQLSHQGDMTNFSLLKSVIMLVVF